MLFEFMTAGRIVFGPGSLAEAGKAAASLGSRAFVLTGSDPSRADRLVSGLRAAGLAALAYPVAGEPRFETVEAALVAARGWGCDLVIGFGGGSAIDAAKAVAALLSNPGPLLDYVEVIGAGKALSRPSLPCIAIPTTAGTGSEVTKNAVLSSVARKIKVSLRSPFMVPRLAIVDPELCYDLPPAATASTGMDALTQVIEPFVCNKPNSLVDAISREGIAAAARSLRTAYREGRNPRAREDMSFAGLAGGMALANARLGAVHGFAAPIGGAFDVPHGAVCAALLAPVAAANVAALRARAPDSPALARYAEVAGILCEGTGLGPRATSPAKPEDVAVVVSELAADLGIRRLSAYGIGASDFPLLVEKALAASSMQGNPIVLEPAELRNILDVAL
jgi:alcohol dehydrogenase class IV